MRWIAIFLCAVLWFLQIPSASAASGCEQYAQNAVGENQQNLANKCGFTGPRWSPDYQSHFRWCVGARQDSVNREADARRNDLGNCSFCSNYTREALVAQQKNLANRCGLTGARWDSNFQNHFRWCMQARRDSVEQEARHRNFDASKCEECTTYTRAAIASNEQNLKNACGFKGATWSSDYGHHFNWCWNLETRQALAGETRKRFDLLNQCQNSANRKAECDQYAKTAMAQFAQYRQRNCGKLTGQWGGDYQNHYGWCLSVSSEQARRETEDRNNQLAKCGASQTPPSTPKISVEFVGHSGQNITNYKISGSGFNPNTSATIQITTRPSSGSASTSNTPTNVDANGNISITLGVSCPTSVQTTHEFTAIDAKGNTSPMVGRSC